MNIEARPPALRPRQQQTHLVTSERLHKNIPTPSDYTLQESARQLEALYIHDADPRVCRVPGQEADRAPNFRWSRLR